LAYFRKNLLYSGRFVRFKNPVKYARGLILTKMRRIRLLHGLK
jgi:hypothetical protein